MVVTKPNAVTVKLDDGQLIRQLKALKGVADDRIIRSALTSAALPIRKEAQALAPKDTGALAKSIGTRTKKIRDWGFEASIAAKVYYAHLVEFGVAIHFISKKSKTGTRVGWRQIHPGHPPHPFLRPAFDTKKDDSVRIARDKLGKAIDKVTGGIR